MNDFAHLLDRLAYEPRRNAKLRLLQDYFAHAPTTAATLARLAAEKPSTLACMHGSAWGGNGGALLRHLAEALVAAD